VNYKGGRQKTDRGERKEEIKSKSEKHRIDKEKEQEGKNKTE
jgi:hypothetical protein